MTSLFKNLKSWGVYALLLSFLAAGTMSSCTSGTKDAKESIEEATGTEEHPEATEGEEHPSDSTATEEEHPTDSGNVEEEHPSEDEDEEHPEGN